MKFPGTRLPNNSKDAAAGFSLKFGPNVAKRLGHIHDVMFGKRLQGARGKDIAGCLYVHNDQPLKRAKGNLMMRPFPHRFLLLTSALLFGLGLRADPCWGQQPLELNPPTTAQSSQKFILGQKLFFDRILSGNRDVACATCHHPLTSTSDDLSLGIGTGTTTLGSIGPARQIGPGREFIPRNAPEIFNRGSAHWTSTFWDSRITAVHGKVVSPAGDQLPEELVRPLEIQAMFPVTSRDEMRGNLADAANGNEIAAINDGDFEGIWQALMARLLALEEYQRLFEQAFPDVKTKDLGFQHAAMAIAEFEAIAFHMADSPYDAFLRGDASGMSQPAVEGMALFFGKAQCGQCHQGPLLTDQQHYNLAVPQLGPGKDPATHLDLGRALQSGDVEDAFAFRTPSLRNVTATGPWMHNGAFMDLESVIRHHLNPTKSLKQYKARHHLTQVELYSSVIVDNVIEEWMLSELDITPMKLSDTEIQSLIHFLQSLKAPNLESRLLQLIPESVPSGLLEQGVPD